MKHILLALLYTLASGILCAEEGTHVTIDNTKTEKPPVSIKIGEQYDIVTSTDIYNGPGKDHKKKINQKASDALGEIYYLSVDTSTTIKVIALQDNWAEIQVVEPEWLKKSHKGWIPAASVKNGAASKKQNGWIKHTCEVFDSKANKAKPIGWLPIGAAVGIAHDGSEWAKLIHGPVKDNKTKEFLNYTSEDTLYLKATNFTTESPHKK